MSDELLFVYGTLREGSTHRMRRVLELGSQFVGAAVFQGRLYQVARYPGATPSDEPGDRVVGEVYRLLDPRETLRRLDRYEGCDPLNPHAPYIRERAEVRLGAGGSLSAWIYLYNRSLDGLSRIVSGDFLDPGRG